MPTHILAAHEIAALPASGQLNAYADRLDAVARGAEFARSAIPPIDLRKLATDMRASAKLLPTSGQQPMEAAADGSKASPFLTQLMASAGLPVRKFKTVEEFDAAARAKGVDVDKRMHLKTALMRENLLGPTAV